MGGHGSGNRYRSGTRSTTDGFLHFSVWHLFQLYRKRGWCLSLQWTQGGEPAGNIRAEIHTNHMEYGHRGEEFPPWSPKWQPENYPNGAVVLKYRHQSYGAEWEAVEDPIPLVWTACNYGGWRPWFQCPSCRRRCGALYGGDLFRCRRCYGLTYAGNNEDESSRLLRKRDKLYSQIGGHPSEPFPDKPRYMHWKTYNRISDGIEEAEHLSLVAVAERLKLFKRY